MATDCNLAPPGAHAAKETAANLENSIKKSRRGAEISDRVSASLQQIVLKEWQVEEFAVNIAVASEEQSQGIAPTNPAVSQMDKTTQSIATTAEETAGASEELNSQAGVLREGVAELSLIMGAKHADNYRDSIAAVSLESYGQVSRPWDVPGGKACSTLGSAQKRSGI